MSKTTKLLPFKTAPAEFEKVLIGNPSIGILELPKMEDLSPNERIFIAENTKNLPDLRLSAVRLARGIAAKSGQKLTDVYDALVASNTQVLGEYLEELLEFQAMIELSTSSRGVVQATAILKYRLAPDWTLENSGDATLIHPKLLAEVIEFARKEDNGWTEEVESRKSEVGSTEEELGKSTGLVAA